MERHDLLASIATTIADYQAGELEKPTADHVDRWVRQFSKDVQLPLLRELDHVFKNTYFKRDYVAAFLVECASDLEAPPRWHGVPYAMRKG